MGNAPSQTGSEQLSAPAMGSRAQPTALRDRLSPTRVSGWELSSRFGPESVSIPASLAGGPFCRHPLFGGACPAAVVTLLSCTLPSLPSSCHAVYRAKVGDAKIIMNPELVREEGFPVLSACSSPQNLFSHNYRTGQLLKCQVTSS